MKTETSYLDLTMKRRSQHRIFMTHHQSGVGGPSEQNYNGVEDSDE